MLSKKSKPRKGNDCYLVVGSSNARRLCDALNLKGIETGFVISQSWRATKRSVADMAAHIQEELKAKKYTVVIFQLLDYNFFFEQGEDGSKALPRKGLDGRYHVVGDLALADKDGQYAILKLCEPLWSSASGKHMVIVGPMARFVSAGCCSDKTHVANRSNKEFYPKLKEDPAASCNNIKDFLFTSGLRHGRVMDPARSTRGLPPLRSGEATPSIPSKRCMKCWRTVWWQSRRGAAALRRRGRSLQTQRPTEAEATGGGPAQ